MLPSECESPGRVLDLGGNMTGSVSCMPLLVLSSRRWDLDLIIYSFVSFVSMLCRFLASLAVKLFCKLFTHYPLPITHYPSLITGIKDEQGLRIARASHRRHP